MRSLTSDTPFRSTLAKLLSALLFVVSATWWLRGEFEDLKQGQIRTAERLSSIEAFMKSEAVTQAQAERYAAAFRWENRSLDLAVPEPRRYQ